MVGGSIVKTPKTHRKEDPDEVLEDDTDEDLFEFTDLGTPSYRLAVLRLGTAQHGFAPRGLGGRLARPQ